MGPSDPNLRLNQIATLWSVVRVAHGGPDDRAHEARCALLARYSGVSQRYSLAAGLAEPCALSCREELLTRSWSALEAHENTTGQPFYTVLRFRANHPDLRSAQMAERLGEAGGKALTAAGVRKTLERARDRF